jgi:Raf kinase inhibitor-like YbhB/YbcL family protein
MANWWLVISIRSSNMKRSSLAIRLMAGLALFAGIAHSAEFKVATDSQVDGRFQNAQFANVMGCQGGNISPHISWQGAPDGTKSFVVTMYDPDAPTGSGWWHWVVVNLPATANELPLGAGSAGGKMPPGAVQINNDGSQPNYGGICPPPGQEHRYIITVHALKVEMLELPPNATPALVGFMTGFNRLGKASLTVLGGR